MEAAKFSTSLAQIIRLLLLVGSVYVHAVAPRREVVTMGEVPKIDENTKILTDNIGKYRTNRSTIYQNTAEPFHRNYSNEEDK